MKEFVLIVAFISTSLFVLPVSVACTQTATKHSAVLSSKTINAEQLLNDVRTLSSDEMEGRKFGTRGGAKARAYIVRRFKETSINPFFGSDFEQVVGHPESTQATKGANVVGFIRGKSQPEHFIVLTAHYDHLGVVDGTIYNGADDNASGVAALLQMAAYFVHQQPEHSIIFATLDAEEGPGAGARTLVKSLVQAKQKIALNINLDMVSHSESGELYAVGTYHYPSLKPFIERVAEHASVKLLTGHDRPDQGSGDWTRQSDHYAFHREKIPFIYFGVEDHRDYHKSTDDFETITRDFFIHSAETILEALKAFDGGLKGDAGKSTKS
jgi:Zn-dependent M28 family amino/carboxypeptidase